MHYKIINSITVTVTIIHQSTPTKPSKNILTIINEKYILLYLVLKYFWDQL
jgi:hypothetical protein